MGIIKTKAIIIAENNLGDYDKMLTMLTPGLGKIGCAAKGARKPTSLLLAGTQFLCFGEYILYKGTGSYNINSCETIEIFYKIRQDLDKLNYSTYITKIIIDVTNENQNSYKILQLFLNTLYVISEELLNISLIIPIFKLRLVSTLGFMPNKSFFTKYMKLSEGTEDIIKYVIMSEAKKIYNISASETVIKELEIWIDLYMEEVLENNYKMSKFML